MTIHSPYDLRAGVLFEHIDVMVPWRTTLSEIEKFGKPQIKWYSEQRTDAIWKNAKILGGIELELYAMFWQPLFGSRKFSELNSYIESMDKVVEIKNHLDRYFGIPHKTKGRNQFEFYYQWRIEGCVISVGQGDRFGPYYYFRIRKCSNLGELLC